MMAALAIGGYWHCPPYLHRPKTTGDMFRRSSIVQRLERGDAHEGSPACARPAVDGGACYCDIRGQAAIGDETSGPDRRQEPLHRQERCARRAMVISRNFFQEQMP
jgi:hypothetical protein